MANESKQQNIKAPKIKDHTVTGNLTSDPQIVNFPDGGRIVTFDIAENHRAFDRDSNQFVDSGVTYYRAAINAERRENLARNVYESLKKGDRVSVQGTYEAEAYATKNNEVRMAHKINCTDVSASLEFNTVEIGPSASAQERAASQNADASASNQPVAPAPDFNFHA